MKMLYPSVLQYLAALENPRKALTTLGKRLVVCADERSEPLCRVSRSSLRVLCLLDGSQRAIRLTLRDSQRTPSGEHYPGELKVGKEQFDLWIEPAWPIHVAPTTHEQPVRDYAEGLYAVECDGFWGFADATGKMVIEAAYDRVEPFCEGRAVVERGAMFGLIDPQGCEVIPLQYDELSYDGSHYCYVDQWGQSGVVDRTGRVVVALEWDWVSEFSQGLLLVERDGRYGYVDTMGQLVIEPIYEDGSSFDLFGYASVVKDGQKYSIDKDQNRV